MDRYIKESEMLEVIDKWQESLSPRTDLRDSVIFDTLESVNFHNDIIPAYCKFHTDKVGWCDDAVYMNEDDFCSHGKKVE